MADLQVCYFCGRGPDGSIGEFAVVPAALDPTPEQQQTVVLCPDCRDKLTTVVEPVVEAASTAAESGTAGASDEGAGSGAAAGGGADAASGSSADAPPSSSDRSRSTDDPSRSTSGASSGRATGDSPAPSDEPSSSEGLGHGASPSGDEGAGDEGVSIDARSEDTSPADDGISIDTGPGEASGTGSDATGSPAAGDGPPPDSNAKRDQPHADDELVGRDNAAYNKTLRLLQNREFPVERHEIEEVAASAYQLDPQDVSDAIDAMIQKGLLVQEGAQLVRP